MATPRLAEYYRETVTAELRDQFGYTNTHQMPKIDKVVVSMGIGDARENPKKLQALTKDLATIAGQQPLATRARISVAQFKVREGSVVGTKVTLRRQRMWEFLDRLLCVALPRIRDFRGLSPKSFDGRGNYSVGFTEQVLFPEIEVDRVEHVHGMNVAVVTTAESDNEARELLRLLGFPFRGLEVVVRR